MSHSAIYRGRVIHQRHRPRAHRFAYQVFSFLIDLDELPRLDRDLRLFGHNRRALFSFWDADHGRGDGSDLRPYVRGLLSEAGIDDAVGPVRLLCYPRVLGYVFNPLSVFYCYDAASRLRALVYEVHNTYRERHCYVVPIRDQAKFHRHACDKAFFVSPFLPMDCRYRFHLDDPGDELRLFIHETHGGEPILDAWFTARRQPLTDANLLRTALALPFFTLKVILAIHWEALKLLCKGVRMHRHPPTPRHGVTLTQDRS